MTSTFREKQRLTQARQWLGDDVRICSASSDASFRSYWRVTRGDASWVLMDAPPGQEDCRPFVDIGARLVQAGIHAPQIIEADFEQGFLLLEDLGTEDYLSVLDGQSAEQLYTDALTTLARIQQLPTDGLPPYGEQLLRQEIQLFPEWLLGRHLGLDLDPGFYRHWTALGDSLVDSALGQPQVFVHRDYHSRNLMRLDTGNPGVLDFQDAVAGPITYDPVSLLRDCYISWPAEFVEQHLQRFREQHPDPAVCATSASQWQHWCDLMGVQRHLKAAGIFCRLCHRDGKSAYLNDIPRTLGHIVAISHRHPCLSWLAALLTDIVPTLEARSA